LTFAIVEAADEKGGQGEAGAAKRLRRVRKFVLTAKKFACDIPLITFLRSKWHDFRLRGHH
jgi:hypothetical protein